MAMVFTPRSVRAASVLVSVLVGCSTVIRNVVVGRTHPGVSVEDVERALQALRDLRVDGVDLALVAGQDLGLRDGNVSYGITVDLIDEEAYRIYDADEEHNRIRAELFVPISASIERVQFRLPD
jgi:hypothetical protein